MRRICTSPRPSATLWCTLSTYAARPPSSPVTILASHGGRSRSNGVRAIDAARSRSSRRPPGRPTSSRTRWCERAKSGSGTQAGVPQSPHGSRTRSRRRGTKRVAHSWDARTRSQSGAVSRTSRMMTGDRRRGSTSARHIMVSSGFISLGVLTRSPVPLVMPSSPGRPRWAPTSVGPPAAALAGHRPGDWRSIGARHRTIRTPVRLSAGRRPTHGRSGRRGACAGHCPRRRGEPGRWP